MPEHTASILLVDPDQRSDSALGELFNMFNYRLDRAHGALEAMRLARENCYDALLICLETRGDAYSLSRRILSLPLQQHTPLAFVTEKESDYMMLMEAKYYGSVFILHKPWDEMQTLAHISTLVRIKSLRDQLQTRVDELALLASTDALTGLCNRRTFLERLEEEIARCERSHETLSLIAIDIDHFKQINDSCGHEAGDVVLRRTSAELRATMRRSDLLARLGGEEFWVMLPATAMERAGKVAERLRQRVERMDCCYDGVCMRVTISMGVSELSRGHDLTNLMRSADQALYEAKHAGRNRVVCASDDFVPLLPVH